MTSGTYYQTAELTGRTVYDSNGSKIGKIGQVWLDDLTGRPDWVTVQTGLFGLNESFLPVEGLRHGQNGDLHTSFSKEQVKHAPNIDPSSGHLEPEQERRLFQHYGVTADHRNEQRYAAGYGNTPGRTTDDAMTRSEERLRIGTEQVEVGRARLRKYVVTERQQVNVPVARERARLETEPITEANRGRAMAGPDLTEEEHEVVLREQRPTVEKEVVPVERVRLTTDVETHTETVSDDVRKERIEAEGDIDGGR